MGEAMQLLLVDPGDWAELRKAVPDDDDLTAIAELYAVDLGESSASPASSSNGGRPSNLTLPSDITSTSARRATARKPSGSAGSTP